MSAKKRGLGRGLDALLGGGNRSSSDEQSSPESAFSGASATVPIEHVVRGRFQPRREFDQEKLQELADSIASQGVIQPVIVRQIAENKYELVAGERRWRASQLANKHDIPVVVKDYTDQEAMAVGLIENIQRDDLNPLEEADALYRLSNEFELTHQQIAAAVGKSRTTVTNLLRLLDLGDAVKQLIDRRLLEMGHARALLGLPADMQLNAAKQVVDASLSVRETEKLVRRLLGKETENPENSKNKIKVIDPDVKRLQTHLTEKLGANVALKQSKGGKGQLIISYNSLEELDGIIDHIQ